MTQEPTQKSRALAGDVARVAMRVREMRSITQLAGAFELIRRDAKPPFVASASLPATQVKQVDDSVVVLANFTFDGQEGKLVDGAAAPAPTETFIRIAATYEILYKLEPGPPLSEADLQAFARINGILNLWPFWRQFVYECLGRAGQTPFYMPPFNPVKFGQQQRATDSAATNTTST